MWVVVAVAVVVVVIALRGGYFLLFFILRQDIGVRENYSGLSMKRFVVVSLFLCWWARDL